MSKDTNFLSKYTNLYEMTKSIELGAIPTETTEQNLEKASIVEKDVLRKYDAEKVEAIYDDLYRKVVNDVLGKVNVDKSLKKLVDAYENKSKDVKTYYAVERELTQKLSEALMKDEFYVAINTANYYNKELPKSLNKDEKALVKNVRFGQFDKFRESRKSLFGDAKNSIAWRVAHDNFLFYMSNCNVLAEALLKLDDKELKTALGNYKNELGKKTDEIYAMLEDFTDKDNYRKLFTQDAIDRYNLLIIGYTKDDRTKVQGLNELINLYNQQEGLAREEKLKLMSPLYKLPMFEVKTFSVVPDSFEIDEELFDIIDKLYTKGVNGKVGLKTILEQAEKLYEAFDIYDESRIYVSKKAESNFSHQYIGKWDALKKLYVDDYIKHNENPRLKGEKLEAAAEKNMKNKIFSLSDIRHLVEASEDWCDADSVEVYRQNTLICINDVNTKYDEYKDYFANRKDKNRPVKRDGSGTGVIRNLCLAIKEVERCLTPIMYGEALVDAGIFYERDNEFYAKFDELVEEIKVYDKLYNKIRNYVSQRNVREDRTQLEFNNDTFLNGWSKPSTDGGAIVRDGDKYYFVCISKNYRGFERTGESADGDDVEVMEYNYCNDMAKSIGKNLILAGMRNKSGSGDKYTFNPSSRCVKEFGLTEEIFDIYQCDLYKDNYALNGIDEKTHKEALKKLIKYLNKALCIYYPKSFDGEGLSDDFDSFKDYIAELTRRNFTLGYRKMSRKAILDMEKEGNIYIFRIWCKDFSKASFGTKNNYVYIFNALFNEDKDYYRRIRLNGAAKIIYTKASLRKDEAYVHKAGRAIENKNPKNPNINRTFKYDIIMDRRKLKDRYTIQLTYTINRQAMGDAAHINDMVKEDIARGNFKNVLAVKTGQDNLLWLTVTDFKGNIVMQKSLNVIRNFDYAEKIRDRQNKMVQGNREWSPETDIKDLKKGYISLAVREIVDTALAYNAVIAVEESVGTREKTFGIDTRLHSVLVDAIQNKLTFLYDKKADALEEGGILNAYQLCGAVVTEKDRHSKFQNGIVFFVNPIYTKNAAPKSAFIAPKALEYTNLARTKAKIKTIKDIGIEKDMLYFDIDDKMYEKTYSGKTEWRVWAGGERRMTEKDDKLAKGRRYVTKDIGEVFKKFLTDNGIKLKGDIKEQILAKDDKRFFVTFVELFNNVIRCNNGYGEDNFIISPVKDAKGKLFDSRSANESDITCTDSNSAYNLAQKMLLTVDAIRKDKDRTIPTTEEYLASIQQ